MEAEILLGTFIYRNYFPKSAKANVFDELESKVRAAQHGNSEQADLSPTFAEFTQTWLSEKKVEWRDSHYTAVIYALDAYALPAFGDKKSVTSPKLKYCDFVQLSPKNHYEKAAHLKHQPSIRR